MIQKAADIERIVRDVLADLGLAPASHAPSVVEKASARASLAEPASEPAEQPLPPPRPVGDVVVADRVVTLARVGERLASARRLVVPPTGRCHPGRS